MESEDEENDPIMHIMGWLADNIERKWISDGRRINLSFKLRIILPIEEVVPPCHIENNGAFNLLSALESAYPLCDIICKYLNYADLNNIGMISDLWHESVEKEKLHRKQPSWSELNSGGFITSSPNLRYAEKSQSIIFHHFEMYLRSYVNVVRGDNEAEMITYTRHLKTDLAKLAEVPSSLRKTHISGCCISPTNSGNEETVRYLSLYLPDIPNITVRNFWFKSKFYKRTANQLSRIVGLSHSIECVLLFSRCDANRSTHGLLNSLLQLQSRVVFGGGIIDAINDGDNKAVSKSDLFCIAFIKQKNVKANFYSASFVLTDDDFEERIKTLKERLEIRENILIFHFANQSKIVKNDYLEILKKTFPNTVVVGINTGFSIGINSNIIYICWGKLLKSKNSK